jgi:hypothetical protein
MTKAQKKQRGSLYASIARLSKPNFDLGANVKSLEESTRD